MAQFGWNYWRSIPRGRLGLSSGWLFSCRWRRRGGSMAISSSRRSRFGGGPDVLAVALPLQAACRIGELILFPAIAAQRKKWASKAVLKTMKFRKKNTLLYSTGNVFPRVLNITTLMSTLWRKSKVFFASLCGEIPSFLGSTYIF